MLRHLAITSRRQVPYSNQTGSAICHRQFRNLQTVTARSMQRHQGILQHLEQRGYVNQLAGDRNVLSKLLETREVGFYAGIDPTAPSLHLGHLLPLMVLFWLYMHGHHVVSLIGGSTAKVGDPTGRLQSRSRTSEEVQQSNLTAMLSQTTGLWDNVVQYGERHGFQVERMGRRSILNNSSWLGDLTLLEFLNVLGRGMRIGNMLSRDTVRNKMERGDGMSFSEFTYPLLQSWDWWHMYNSMNVQVQVGGSDQYGNIVAGLDAIKYMTQLPFTKKDATEPESDLSPMGLTVPLLTTSSGDKFGKSAGNAIWLDSSLTSSFDLYGFLLRSSDADIERYLKLFTFLPLEHIAATMMEHFKSPEKRVAQHLLAQEVLELVHGRKEALETKTRHESMRSPSSNVKNTRDKIVLAKSLAIDSSFPKLLYHAGIVSTRSEGSRLIANGGLYVASSTREPIDKHEEGLEFISVHDQLPRDLIRDGTLIVRLGKWKIRVIEIVDDDIFNSAS